MKDEEYDDPRREFLIKALAAGMFALTAPTAEAGWWGREPRKLPANQSFYQLRGKVLVNGETASMQTIIRPGDKIETGKGSKAVFAVGSDAFIMRSRTKMNIAGSNDYIDTLRLLQGKLLSVFGSRKSRRRQLGIRTPTATMGIRGTGVYLEATPDESYLCTCYGIAEIASSTDKSSTEVIESVHHDKPRYIAAKGAEGKLIREAPFKNHSDQELRLIEALVGREPPFGIEGQGYKRPRRDY